MIANEVKTAPENPKNIYLVYRHSDATNKQTIHLLENLSAEKLELAEEMPLRDVLEHLAYNYYGFVYFFATSLSELLEAIDDIDFGLYQHLMTAARYVEYKSKRQFESPTPLRSGVFCTKEIK